jgi:hypothetical protein
MALIAALSGFRRHSSARLALSQPRCTGRDIPSPKTREMKFSGCDGVRPSVGLRRKGSKIAIASHKHVAAQGCAAKVGGCSEHHPCGLNLEFWLPENRCGRDLRNASSDSCGLLYDDKLSKSRTQEAASFLEFLLGTTPTTSSPNAH